MGKQTRHPTLFALDAEQLRRDGRLTDALARFTAVELQAEYPTATVVSLLLAAAGGEEIPALQQLCRRFPVPLYLIEQLQQLGAITATTAGQLLQRNRESDRLAEAAVETEPVGVDVDIPAAKTTVPSEEEISAESHRFQTELAQALQRNPQRPAAELIAELAGAGHGGEPKSIASLALAQLLEEQGHLAEALEMYHALPEGDDKLEERIAELRLRLEQQR